MDKFTVTFATRYNGVYVTPNWDNIPKDEKNDVDAVVDYIGDTAADTLPEFTYEHADNWEHDLSSEDIVKLRSLALEIINKYLPNVTLDEVGFEYDEYSS